MKILKMLIIFISFALIHNGCGTKNQKIKIGILPVIDTLPLIIAETEGIFKDNHIDVELIEFNSALEKGAAFASGNLDAEFGDLITALLTVKTGIDSKIVIESSHTSRNDRKFGLITAPGSSVKNIKEALNEEIAISRGSIIEFMLDQIALANRIDPGIIKKIEIKTIPVRYQMLMSGSVRMALLPEPLVSKAVKEGARIIADDRNLDLTATVIIFNSSFLQHNREKMNSLLAAYRAAVKRLNSCREKYRELMVSRLHLPESIKNSFRTPAFDNPVLPSEKNVMLIYNWMKNNGLISIPLKYTSITWTP